MTKRILVADDEADIRLLLTTLLRHAGYEVLTATDGREAVEIAFRERPDLVLLDVAMPAMDGYAALERIKAEPALAGTTVILLTARDTPAAMAEGWERGTDLYLTKPFRPAELLDYIRAIFEE